MKLSEMNEDELRVLTKKRFKNGRLTKQALEAQRELWIRHDRPLLGMAMILATGKIS